MKFYEVVTMNVNQDIFLCDELSGSCYVRYH